VIGITAGGHTTPMDVDISAGLGGIAEDPVRRIGIVKPQGEMIIHFWG